MDGKLSTIVALIGVTLVVGVGCSKTNQTSSEQVQSAPETFEAPLEKIAGFRKPDNIASVAKRQNAFAVSLLGVEKRARDAYIRKHPSFGAAEYDLQSCQGPRDQRQCLNCT